MVVVWAHVVAVLLGAVGVLAHRAARRRRPAPAPASAPAPVPASAAPVAASAQPRPRRLSPFVLEGAATVIGLLAVITAVVLRFT